ncbi:MAG: hypothetical protein WBA57_09090 [Elainellaceae cyanobacterium]
MVTKKHLHQISLPNFHSASRQGSPSDIGTYAADSESGFGDSSGSQDSSSVANAYSFQIQAKGQERSPNISAANTSTPSGVVHHRDAPLVGATTRPDAVRPDKVRPDGVFKRTALPLENRNPAIALLKDALKPDAPSLPSFKQSPHQEHGAQNQTVAAAATAATSTAATSTLSAPSSRIDSPSSPQKSKLRGFQPQGRQRRRALRKRRNQSRRSWLHQLWMLRPSLKPALGQAKSSGQLKSSKSTSRQVQTPPKPEPVAPPPLTPEEIAALLEERRQRQARSRLWSLVWILGIVALSSMGGIAYSLLTQLPPATDCEGLSPLTSDGERLYCAQVAAQSGDRADLIAGIQLIENWKPSHPMYRKAQVSMTEWSAALLNEAKLVLQEEGLEPAVEIATQVPPSSPLYEEAQDRINTWQQEWQQGEEMYAKAIAAMSEQSWGIASNQVRALGQLDFPYWKQTRADELSRRILHEQEAYQVLQAAQQKVEDDPSQIATALADLQEIASGKLVSDEAQALMQQWGDILIAKGMEALDAGDLSQALDFVQSVPLELIDEPMALDLVRLSQAKQLAELEPSHWQSNPVGLWRLMEAIAAAQAIEPDSLLYDEAQTAIAQWQGEREDLTQLQMAQWIASFGNRYAFDLAKRQAEAVAPRRPRRVQAQTLIAHWRQETQRILDRPFLVQAVTIAEAGTLESFRTAIAAVQSIDSSRAIFPQVEQAIAQWNQEIQAIEDGPILEEARQLATEGQWRDAIAKAETIGADRALHEIAQGNVAEWRSKLQLEIDQQWLVEARSLAQRRRLTNAIGIASQIQPSQPLYSEAQAEISQWVEEREAIRAQQTPEPSPTPPSPTRSPAAPAPAPQQPSTPPAGGNYEGYFDSRYYNQ